MIYTFIHLAVAMAYLFIAGLTASTGTSDNINMQILFIASFMLWAINFIMAAIHFRVYMEKQNDCI